MNSALFQFHNGTIKTEFSQILNLHHSSFNSITVQLRLRMLLLHILVFRRFNSITVQLRLTCWLYSSTVLYGFNSITVQLRPRTSLWSKEFSRFQFHNGTIKTARFEYLGKLLTSFNSITVQLRLSRRCTNFLLIFCFNSITVQLRLRNLFAHKDSEYVSIP